MSVARLNCTVIGDGNTGTFNFTVPAGISVVFLNSEEFGPQPSIGTYPINVTPGSTYTITINTTSLSTSVNNSFGSLFYWTPSAYLKVSWLE